jgi:hypothetical protein
MAPVLDVARIMKTAAIRRFRKVSEPPPALQWSISGSDGREGFSDMAELAAADLSMTTSCYTDFLGHVHCVTLTVTL